ncbi:MAG: S9 family peptidase [Anaerolineales bacterium]|nr:S9 family peptidase [Anaerolineales bacterium]
MASPKKRALTAEDLYQFKVLSDTRIAPDGGHVVYSLQRVDQKTEKKYSNLWIVDTLGGSARQFTYGDQNDAQPRWSPDGAQLAFLSNRADKEKPGQLHLIPFTGGEARPLTDIPGVIGGFSWSPDGKRILCMARKFDPDELERQKDEQKKKLGVVSRRYNRLFYKLDGVGYLAHERWHLWVVDARSGKAKQITDHPIFDEQEAAWSPDGKAIIFLSNRSQDPDLQPDRIDLMLISSEGGEARKIDTPVGGKMLPSFSPDGRWIAYYGSEGEGLDYKNNDLWIVPVDQSVPAHNLTEKYDLHVSAWTINDIGQAETMPPTWSLDGQRLYFPVAYHGSSILKSIALDGEDLQTVIPEAVDDQPGSVVGSFSFSRDQRWMAYCLGTLSDPAQIWLLDCATGARRKLAAPNEALLRNLELGKVETHWIKGPDGNDLQGWILKPPGFDPAVKYPSILEIHGGPLTQYGYLFMHEFNYLAAQGYVVYFSNPRGGRGYGQEHAKAIYGDWGSKDYADLMAWTDYVATLPYIDVSRMGVTGGSYGGYMTVWIIGHTQRFKAAVTQRCVSNLVSMWGSSDFNWAFQQTFRLGPPFEDLEGYWRQSPIAYIGNARTPTKVIHNEFDLRCPIEQGEQVFVALKYLGVETEMARFPDEFHGLSRNGRTDRRIGRLNHILSWFEKYLK